MTLLPSGTTPRPDANPDPLLWAPPVQESSGDGPLALTLDLISALTPLAVALLLVLRLLVIWWRGWDRYVRCAILLRALPGSDARRRFEDEFRFVCPLHGPDLAPAFFAEVSKGYEVADTNDYTVRPVAVSTRYWSFDIQRGPRMGWLSWLVRCGSLALTRRYEDPRLDERFLC